MFFSKALTGLVLAGAALAQTFSINTPPSIQQCQPAALTWVGGTGPFVIAAIPAGQVSAPALATIAASVSASPYSWNVNLAQGTAITIRITDSLGNIAYSSPLTVQAGSSGCIGASASGSGSPAPSVTGSSAVASLSSVAASQSSAVASLSSSASAAATSSVSTSVSGSSTSTSVSRAASSTPAASSSGSSAGAKTSFNVPFLALAAALGCAAFGGFALLA